MTSHITIAAIIILTLIAITWTILNTVMQPGQPICEKEGYPAPQEWCDNRAGRE